MEATQVGKPSTYIQSVSNQSERGKQSTDIHSVSNQSEVLNNSLSWEQACKYCEKPFNNEINYEKHVAVCQKVVL